MCENLKSSGSRIPHPSEGRAYTNTASTDPYPDQAQTAGIGSQFIGSQWAKILYAKREQLRYRLQEIDEALTVLEDPTLQKLARVFDLINS